jgi:hypothetical protein
MGCKSRQPGWSTGGRGDSGGVRSRMSVLLCLLAFAFQLTGQAVHLGDVATERGGVAIPFVLGSAQSTTTLAAVDHIPQRPLHHPALCCICQALSRFQVGLLTPSWTTGTSAPGAWLVPLSIAPVSTLSLAATAPRAPPSLS